MQAINRKECNKPFQGILTSKETENYPPPKGDLCQCLSPSHISCAKCLDPVKSNRQGLLNQAQIGCRFLFRTVQTNDCLATAQDV